MKATELILNQHHGLEDLFAQFGRAEGEEKRRVFEQLASRLVGHDAIERELFYPACEEALGDEALGEAVVEHGVLEFCVFCADEQRDSDDFERYVQVLQEFFEHHIQEEEGSLLPKAKRALDDERLESLGEDMAARFDELQEADFRGRLRDHLEQVLKGRAKTSPKSKRAPATPRAGAAPRARTRRAGAPSKKPRPRPVPRSASRQTAERRGRPTARSRPAKRNAARTSKRSTKRSTRPGSKRAGKRA